jgi:hypothetical protein
MTPSKETAPEPKDRRHDVERRIRYAIRKANDRMFAPLEKPAQGDPGATSPQRRS